MGRARLALVVAVAACCGAATVAAQPTIGELANPTGTNPTGTNPTGTNPTGTNPTGTNPPVANAAPAARTDGGDKPVQIGVVDVQFLLQQSLAAQSIHRQSEEQRVLMQRDFSAQEERFRASEQELARLRGGIAQDAFDEKRREFERQVGEARRTIQDRTRVLDTAFGQARETLYNTTVQVVQEVSQEKGMTIVVPRQSVLFLRDPSLDLTEAALRRLNQRLPQVTVNLPSAANP